VRAMGAEATRPPDLPPADELPKKPTAGEVLVAALRRDVGRVFAHDPFVRLREPVAGGDSAVHQMRVGTRRLRSHLRGFRSLVDPEWADGLRAELGWLADALGVVRDAEVLRARLRKTAGADPLAPMDQAAVARIDAELAARQEEAQALLDEALDSPRYLALLETLVATARKPPLSDEAKQPAGDVLPRLVSRPWRKLAEGNGDVPGAGALSVQAPDHDWHLVRIRGKRVRYLTEAIADAFGDGAVGLAAALATVQGVLGEHQDAAVAANTWLDIAKSDPDDHVLAVTGGRLYERERAAVRRARTAFPAAWHTATRKKVTQWLS
jgi:CHAD domain-containing protein